MLTRIIMLIISCALFVIPMTSKLYAITTLVAPTLLLIYLYRATTRREILYAFIGLFIATVLSSLKVIPGGLAATILSTGIMSAAILLLLLLNRWVVSNTGAAIGILFYPILMTAYEYFISYGTPYSTFSSSVYSLVAVKPLMQWASVGGIWLMIFIVNLILSLSAYAFREKFQVRYAVIASVIALAMVFGGMLLYSRQPLENIRATGLTPDRHAWSAAAGRLFGNPEDKPNYDREAWNLIAKELMQETGDAARGGSQLVVWAEGSVALSPEDEAKLLTEAQAIARENKTVLVLSYVRIHDKLEAAQDKWMDNLAVIIDTEGEILTTYIKAAPVFSETLYFSPGTEPVPVVDTAYGRIALAICYDADQPSRILLAGQQTPQLLIIPASDWQAITPYHTRLSSVRAIENRMSVLRVTKAGLSAVYDSNGTEIASQNDFDSAAGSVFHTNVPIATRTATLYQKTGDILPLICVLLSIVMPPVILIAFLRKRRAS